MRAMSNFGKLKLTYIGWPRLQIEIAGLKLLTDPTFDPPRTYQQGTFTHSKLTGPAIESQALGTVDAVLLSHDHHFDNPGYLRPTVPQRSKARAHHAGRSSSVKGKCGGS